MQNKRDESSLKSRVPVSTPHSFQTKGRLQGMVDQNGGKFESFQRLQYKKICALSKWKVFFPEVRWVIII